ncbi:MAG: XRE family transcriptional regulator [Lachnospiraceae bacterium]|nr:XRE family transcriptional regulator [Lachnospiraceae bacterium]
MEYTVKHMNEPIMRFSLLENISAPVVRILWKTDKENLLPLDMTVSDEGLSHWLRNRTIPKNRAFVNKFLAKCGLSINRPMDIISVSKGLSLNDVYWVVEEGFDGTYEKYNLYDNNFSNVLALIAFTGYGSSQRSSLASCPEFTTNGMLPKCWRRISGKVYLYKGGTSGASNTGYEPQSEYYASQVAKVMGINAIDYRLTKWQGVLCSSCELFTGLDYSYVPVGRLVKSGGLKAVRESYRTLGDDFVDALNEMIVFDAIICNTDRHFGNFGVLVDIKTNTIAKPAPLFDHGNSLFNYAGEEDLVSEEAFESYISTLVPLTYDNFIAEAKSVMTDRNREQVRKLLTYTLKKSPRYNVSEKRYKRISEQIQKRAAMLLA